MNNLVVSLHVFNPPFPITEKRRKIFFSSPQINMNSGLAALSAQEILLALLKTISSYSLALSFNGISPEAFPGHLL